MGCEPGPDFSVRAKHAPGKGHVDKRLKAYNAGGAIQPFLVLRDLDRDAECAAALAREQLPQPSRFMCYRIVVPSVEAWLLADQRAASVWLKCGPDDLPDFPEALGNAKQVLMDLARKHASKDLRDDLAPSPIYS